MFERRTNGSLAGLHSNFPRSRGGGAHSSLGGRSVETHTAPDLIFSSFLRSFEALPLRKPRSVDEAVPYVLRALARVLVETVLELRALRTLLDLLTVDGIGGTGTARREDEVLEPAYSGGRM